MAYIEPPNPLKDIKQDQQGFFFLIEQYMLNHQGSSYSEAENALKDASNGDGLDDISEEFKGELNFLNDGTYSK